MTNPTGPATAMRTSFFILLTPLVVELIVGDGKRSPLRPCEGAGESRTQATRRCAVSTLNGQKKNPIFILDSLVGGAFAIIIRFATLALTLLSYHVTKCLVIRSKKSGLAQRGDLLTDLVQQLDQLPAFSRGKVRHQRRGPAKMIGKDLLQVALAGRGQQHFHSATILRMVDPRDQSVALQAIEEARHCSAGYAKMIGQLARAGVIGQLPELKARENRKAPGRYFVTVEMDLQSRLQVARNPHQNE